MEVGRDDRTISLTSRFDARKFRVGGIVRTIAVLDRAQFGVAEICLRLESVTVDLKDGKVADSEVSGSRNGIVEDYPIVYAVAIASTDVALSRLVASVEVFHELDFNVEPVNVDGFVVRASVVCTVHHVEKKVIECELGGEVVLAVCELILYEASFEVEVVPRKRWGSRAAVVPITVRVRIAV